MDYAYTMIDGKKVFMHDMIMQTPKGYKVVHKNGNGLDNRKSNLKLVKTINALTGKKE